MINRLFELSSLFRPDKASFVLRHSDRIFRPKSATKEQEKLIQGRGMMDIAVSFFTGVQKPFFKRSAEMKFWQYTRQTVPKFHFGTPSKVFTTFGTK